MNLHALCVLLVSIFMEAKTQSGEVEGHCHQVVNIFPAKLRELRTTFNKVKDYFQMKDDALNTILLEDNLLQEFKGSLGCHSVVEMLRFYLEDVLPNAISGSKGVTIDVSYIGNQLVDLRHTLRRCHNFLPCDRKSRTVKQIKETYKKMQAKGIYKAMGEFDIFIDYIEDYLMSKKK
ncbi:interleukin-10 [Bombina bombina]|uniref:interleukin-10 n=1 Tax=Bombina bombina TaxID=8345 RepID=UPI00235AE5F4|nr:interleukin-10 [Bombina bombina]